MALSLECQNSRQSRSFGQTYSHHRVSFFISKALRGTSTGFCSITRGAKSLKKGQPLLWLHIVDVHPPFHPKAIHLLYFQVQHTQRYKSSTVLECILCAHHCPNWDPYMISFNAQFYGCRNDHSFHCTHRETLREIKSLSKHRQLHSNPPPTLSFLSFSLLHPIPQKPDSD